MVAVQSCCGCISLKTGTIIIGTLSLISAVVNVGIISTNINGLPSLSSVMGFEGQMSAEKQVQFMWNLILTVALIAVLIYTLVGVIATIVLLVGASKKVPHYIFPWLALSFGGVVSTICAGISFVIVSAIVFPIGLFFLSFAIFGVVIALQVYFWFVVYSRYQEITAESFGQQANPNAGKVFAGMAMPYHNV